MTQSIEQNPNLYKRIWRKYMRAHIGKIALAFAFMIIVAACTAATAGLLQPVIDDLFINKREDLIPFVIIAFTAILSIRGIASFCQTVLLAKTSLSSVRQMQEEMYASLIHSDIKYLHSEGSAKQLSRFTMDVLRLRQGMEQVLIGGKDIFTVCALIGMMFYTNWQLSLAAFIFFPISIYPIRKIGRRLRKVSKQLQEEVSTMTSVLDDALKNLRQVKAYNREDYEIDRANHTFDLSKSSFYKAISTRALSNPILDTLSGIILGVSMGWASFMVIDDRLTTGEFVAFITAAGLAFQPVRSLSNLWSSIQEAMAAAERIFDIIDLVPSITDTENRPSLTPNFGKVEFRNVSFQYNLEGDKILRDVVLTAEAGQTIALVGPSGAGKSTILNLIPRFYDTTAGDVLIDNQDIKSVTLSSLRNQLGLVSQETGLFNDTIRANILYGNATASDEELFAAAEAASAHEFILELENGYETMVGEMGVKLSGGQRQRISIARAMLKNAPILLLDEATSALDTESERKVQKALETLMQGRTTIVIAHRLSTIVNADKIYVMDQGQVIESGTHGELLTHDGLYAKLHAMQRTSEEIQDHEIEVVSDQQQPAINN